MKLSDLPIVQFTESKYMNSWRCCLKSYLSSVLRPGKIWYRTWCSRSKSASSNALQLMSFALSISQIIPEMSSYTAYSTRPMWSVGRLRTVIPVMDTLSCNCRCPRSFVKFCQRMNVSCRSILPERTDASVV